MEIDLSRLDLKTRNRVDEIFRRDYDLRVLKAIKRQTAIAARNELHRPRAKDGFGPRTLEIDATIDAIWRRVYGHNYSEDQDLVKFLVKRNPEIRVRAKGAKIQVGYAAGAESKRPVGIRINRRDAKSAEGDKKRIFTTDDTEGTDGKGNLKAPKRKCDCWGNQCCDICTGWAKAMAKGELVEDRKLALTPALSPRRGGSA